VEATQLWNIHSIDATTTTEAPTPQLEITCTDFRVLQRAMTAMARTAGRERHATSVEAEACVPSDASSTLTV
jgi:hypothetical protein